MSIPDDFILQHNRSVTPGVYYMTLCGSTKDYSVILDSRNHSLFLYVDSSTGQNFMHHINAKACSRKLIHVLRDKFNEADRPFVPSFFNSVVAYEEYFKEKPVETRPATLNIKENVPTYSVYPVFSVKNAPLLTLLLRVRSIFEFLVTQKDVLKLMFEEEQSVSEQAALDMDRVIIDEIIARSGHLVLNPIALIRTEEESVETLMPKITSELGFQPFEVIAEMQYVVKLSQIRRAFKHLNHFGEYMIAEVDESFDVTDTRRLFRTFNLSAMTDSEGNLYECFVGTQTEHACIWFKVADKRYTTIKLEEIKPKLLLLRNSRLLPPPAEQTVRVIGEYVKPQVAEKVVMPFRTPVSCKQMSLDDCVDGRLGFSYPCYVQRKFDGNRAIVYSLLGGEVIRFYSRSGYKLSTSFDERFTKELRVLSKHVCEKLGRPLANLHFDFECYDHGTIHAEIAGLCNARTAKPGFERLKLHLLSCFVLDDVEKYTERKREYTSSRMNFAELLKFSNSIGLPLMSGPENAGSAAAVVEEESYETLCLSESRLIQTQDELSSFMKESVEGGYEGLVVYPPDNRYVFGHDRLFKLKKVYDGEVMVTGFIESDIEPGAIGSVMVKSRPYLGIRGVKQEDSSEEPIEYKVTASLRKEFKENSMYNDLFKQCVGKYFTIICDSFSNTGIPMHSRFKLQLHPDSARNDVDRF